MQKTKLMNERASDGGKKNNPRHNIFPIFFSLLATSGIASFMDGTEKQIDYFADFAAAHWAHREKNEQKKCTVIGSESLAENLSTR